ncbi:hypothetical protein GXB85_07530 [Cellulomonas sp. APG4]|uniref:DUF6544 family protein n=1 Tax=Cellulomonas sp. APG4 TaxID=1538656 RepID=UPI001379D61C|nr:DUF6544 family protein [Cellulomonas sp. APG4]NCT90797.1 hypothetical protein [Cellulomonas sp. APG4]
MPSDLSAVPRSALAVADQWVRLAAPTPVPAPFDPTCVDRLPIPVARWVRHSIAPGTPLTRTLLLEMDGLIRLGAWRPFTASQVLASSRGFIWTASARFGPVPVVGYDRWAEGQGEMRWRMAGLVPVMSGTGPDVTRSGAGRLAAEAFLSPTTALDPSVAWRGVDDHRAVAELEVGGWTHAIDAVVDDTGRLTEVSLPRWGGPAGEPFALHRFGVFFTGEREDGGVRLPETIEAGWFPGTDRWSADGLFFRAVLRRVVHR